MTSFIQQKQNIPFSVIDYERHEGVKIRSHEKQFQGEIQEELDRCEQVYLTKIYGIIEEWKKFSVDNYKQVIAKVDKSLISEVNKIICEQINIEKDQILQKMNEMGSQILAKTRKTPKEALDVQQKHDKTIVLAKNKEKSYSILKTRSISGEGPRRKLSKGSIFAQAKRINGNQSSVHDGMMKTNPVSGFYNRNEKEGSKVKKLRRKEENCFQVLQKCNSNTSPSNFMMNYINSKDNRPNDSHLQKSHTGFTCMPKQKWRISLNGQNICEQNQQVPIQPKLIPPPIENNFTNQSQTYQKLMVNFQEKISKKLDDLMNKYTKIEQKLQTNAEQKKQRVSIMIPQTIEKSRDHKISIDSSFAQSRDQLINLPQTLKSLKKLSKQEIDLSNTLKRKDENGQTTVKNVKQSQPLKKGIKCIDVNNKIIKNKTKIVENLPQSLEEISICTDKLIEKSSNQELIEKNQEKLQQEEKQRREKEEQAKKRLLLKSDQQYYESLLSEFYETTQKIIFPISKQLLYVVLFRYEKFCRTNNMQSNFQLLNIQTKKLQNFQKEYKELLEKIEKVLNAKCEEKKKEKALLYFTKFVKVVCAYDPQQNLIIRQGEMATQSQLKARVQQLRAKLTQ